MEDIRGLEPKALWQFFYDLTQIPRPSGFMKAVQAYMLDFGKKHGLETKQDEAGNILIRRAAAPGMEHKPALVLQAHLDMVPQKNSEVIHDFQTDPIQTTIDGEWVKAKQTTLGSDNGIGVAAIMAVLTDETIQTGVIEGLFTVDEETGMYGAFGLKPDFFDGRVLLNLDSEDEGELFVGCAGGIDVTATFRYSRLDVVPEGHVALRLDVKGLKGGHSGVDIHLGRANANKVLFLLLKDAVAHRGVRLASFEGGTLRNAIPREAHCVLTLPKTELESLTSSIAIAQQAWREAYKGIERDFSFTLQTVDMPEGVLPAMLQDDVIHSIVSVHDGVYRTIPEMPDVVETSSNLAICVSEAGCVRCSLLLRSSSEFMKEQLVTAIQSSFALAGAKVETSGAYPGWQPNLQSPVMQVASRAYELLYNKTPRINVIHAGLECGIIQKAVGAMDMISFGPSISFPHSPDEKVHILSVARFWTHLKKTIELM